MPNRLKRTQRNLLADITYRLQRLFSPSLPHKNISAGDEHFRHLSFTFAVIAISARVACADGKLTRGKYLAFRESFPLMGGVCNRIRSLFTMACYNHTPVEHYVGQVKQLFPARAELFNSLVDRLFRIAAADGKVTRASERLLARIAHMLELSPGEYMAIRMRHDSPPKAHQILGLGKRAGTDTLKKRYRELMRTYHPDRFATEELSPEIALLLSLKTSEINQAYQYLSRKAA